nr:tRNA lysidine(34) synthetase TilS [Nanchangia anserum]
MRHHLEAAFADPVTLVLAVSGGADSMALALAAIDGAPRLGHRVVTVTIDHGLRPESGEEARRTAAALRDLGADEARIERVSVTGPGGPEAAARDARWDALNRHADELGAAAILTGHTADDQAETVLLALARGSGTRALAGMGSGLESPGQRVHRPLLGLRRATLREALRQVGVTWAEDPTNRPDGPWRAADGSPLRRAAVRAEALPALRRALGVDPVPALARTAALARRDADALDAAAAEWLAEVVVPAEDGEEARARCSRLVEAPEAVRARVLRQLSIRAGARPGDLGVVHIAALDGLVTCWRGQGPIDLPGGVLVRRVSGSSVLVWWRSQSVHSV